MTKNQIICCFSSLTAHGIDENFKRLKFILHAMPLSDERHTGAHLSEVFDTMLQNWQIENGQVRKTMHQHSSLNVTNNFKVHVVVRDGGTNIIKALELSDVKSLSCFAHSLNLIVQSGK